MGIEGEYNCYYKPKRSKKRCFTPKDVGRIARYAIECGASCEDILKEIESQNPDCFKPDCALAEASLFLADIMNVVIMVIDAILFITPSAETRRAILRVLKLLNSIPLVRVYARKIRVFVRALLMFLQRWEAVLERAKKSTEAILNESNELLGECEYVAPRFFDEDFIIDDLGDIILRRNPDGTYGIVED